MEQLELVKPSLEFIDEYQEMLSESLAAGEDMLGYLLRLMERVGATKSDYASFLRLLEYEESGVGLPPGVAPQTTYWLLCNGKSIVGESRLRHYLTPSLEIEGGHIGYFIRRSVRRLGYGTKILELMLEKAREKNLNRVLVTCDTDNIGSARIIQKNGGIFEGEDVSPRTGKLVSRYWIRLG